MARARQMEPASKQLAMPIGSPALAVDHVRTALPRLSKKRKDLPVIGFLPGIEDEFRTPIRSRRLKISAPRMLRDGDRPQSLGAVRANRRERQFAAWEAWNVEASGGSFGPPETFGECPPEGPCGNTSCRHHAYNEVERKIRIDVADELIDSITAAAVESLRQRPDPGAATRFEEVRKRLRRALVDLVQSAEHCQPLRASIGRARSAYGEFLQIANSFGVTVVPPSIKPSVFVGPGVFAPDPAVICSMIIRDIVKVNFTGRDVDQIPETCTLRVANQAAKEREHGAAFSKPVMECDEVGRILNLTAERVRQIEAIGLRKWRERVEQIERV